MKALLFYFLVLFCSQTLHAQSVNFNWAKQMGGTGGAIESRVALDAAGNVYTTGNFGGGTIDFDPGPGVYNLTCAGSYGVFISKLDASGNFVWAKKIESLYIQVNSLTVDASGDVSITGLFARATDFDPGPGIFNLNPMGKLGVFLFICKLDATGNFVWAKSLGVDDPTRVETSSITNDASGNIYVTGFFEYKVDFDPGPGTNILTANIGYDMFILKLDGSGNFVWVKQMQLTDSSVIGGSGIIPLSIRLDAAGNIYTTGWFYGIADFDPGPGTFILSNAFFPRVPEIFICKLDAAGNFVWAKNMRVISADLNTFRSGRAIAIDLAGNVYTTGFFQGTVDFDPGPAEYDLSAGKKNTAFLSKLDAAGNFIWAIQMTEDSDYFSSEGYSVNISSTGNIITTGYFSGKVDFDPGTGIFNLDSNGPTNVFISCLNATGNFIWAKQIGGGRNGVLLTNSSVLDAFGNIYTTGSFSDTLDFDPGAAIFNLSSIGSNDIYIQKMSPCISSSSNTINASSCTAYTLNGQNYTASGHYTQLLTNTAGCDSIVTLDLTITMKFSSINASICPGQNYLGHTNPGTYTDTLFTINGCDTVRTINLTIKNDCIPFYIPNAFSPNGDGLNDLFKPSTNQTIQQYRFIIFNRYGEKIFETHDQGKGWDGTFKGKKQPTGSYVYRISFTSSSGLESENNGSVLLIR